MQVQKWLDETVLDIARQFRWSFLPPLMVYFAAGISGLVGIVGTFFVKEHLGLSAAFLAGLAFWAGIPWALKMPIGHLVDVIWRWKSLLIFVGAGLVAASLSIMYALISFPAQMAAFMDIEAWYVLSVFLAPSGYVLQDAVADAMSVEAVPQYDEDDLPFSEDAAKAMHTTMQTLGRIALISGLFTVALVNIYMFAGIEGLDQSAKAQIYARVYLIGFCIPAVSISGVLLATVLRFRQRRLLQQAGLTDKEITDRLDRPGEPTQPNYWYFGGGLAFAVLAILSALAT